LGKLGEGKVGDISYEELIFQKLCTRVEALEWKEIRKLNNRKLSIPLPLPNSSNKYHTR
jgi:hypothetical protein